MKLLLLIILLCGSTWTPGYVVKKQTAKPTAKENVVCDSHAKKAEKPGFEIVPSVLLFQF